MKKSVEVGNMYSKISLRVLIWISAAFKLQNNGNQGVFGSWISVNVKDGTGEQQREEFGP